jgi:NAD(P)-dependent dehydrogenase (short-subunit alcohol dehydrogenase family)
VRVEAVVQIKDKLVVITGAGKGIGRAMAQAFAAWCAAGLA